ncbi:MAG: GntR family transcriptional regulator [Candidatus Meridianibacter frigidus]|nr:MAG: GntR family transcriptional regulator [Candidatus Eremiobacteraeota bacterium]
MTAQNFYLDPQSAMPVYAQIREQILRALASGKLKEGEQLPTVRQIAVHLRINPNTVNRAYIDLERAGIVQTARGRGSFVAGQEERPDAELQVARLRDIARRAIGEARSLGFSGVELVDALSHAIKNER